MEPACPLSESLSSHPTTPNLQLRYAGGHRWHGLKGIDHGQDIMFHLGVGCLAGIADGIDTHVQVQCVGWNSVADHLAKLTLHPW